MSAPVRTPHGFVMVPVLGKSRRRALGHQPARIVAAQHACDAIEDGSQSFHAGKVQASPSVLKLNGGGKRQ